MTRKDARRTIAAAPAGERVREFANLSHRILGHANRGAPRLDFLREITRMLLDFSQCDAVELRVRKEDSCIHCEGVRQARGVAAGVEITRAARGGTDALCEKPGDGSGLRTLCRAVAGRHPPGEDPCLTTSGSFWTGNMRRCLAGAVGVGNVDESDSGSASLAIIPLAPAEETIGLVLLKSRTEDHFREAEIELYENVARTLGLALVSQLAHAALRERIKELTCLYSLAQLTERPGITLEEILRGAVELLPAAWQYPEITQGRISLDGAVHATEGFQPGAHRQSAEIVVNDRPRGAIEVVYTEQRPELDEGPFLTEERSLIDAVAREIALTIERRQADEERLRLEDQLRHADRLATIGQLAAGVAHELNEPLGNILGFAQLAQKHPDIPGPVVRDFEKIVTTSLHAREIVRKLMLFARQMPPQKTPVDLNVVVEDGLYFLESRCTRGGVGLVRDLSGDLPRIVADPAQLNQVLVNLVVNAIQAMPEGGTLTIRTRATDDHVVLRVEDNGVGMSEEVLEQVFLPFFTTKDIDEGTGLGLPVVHGIVTSHGGTIDVQSAVGRGTRFEIRLPVTNAAEDAAEDKEDLIHGGRG